jgi:glycosyltransferase involved in cell wall biosynthesis
MRATSSAQDARNRRFDVSIVVPTHNRASLLERTLASLAELNIPSGIAVELVVVASACIDDTFDVVRKAEGRLRFVVQAIEESHAGLSLARNRGLAAAQADLIAFLDDDIWVERDWLTALVRAAGHLPAGLLAGRVSLEWESCRPKWTSPAVEGLLGLNDLGGEVRELVTCNQLRGANFALRRSVAENIGNFSLTLGRRGSELLSGEESELGQRAIAAGHRVFYVPDMAVRHWIPRERSTVEYLEAVAFARGRTRVALQRTGRGKCIRLGVAQTLLGGTRALQGWLHRDDVKRVAASLLCHRGLGTLFALTQCRPSKTS